MDADGTLIYSSGKWVESDTEEAEESCRFKDIWHFVPNLIGYGRIGLCLLACLAINLDIPVLAAALILVSILLDWIDGPLARSRNECSIFGSGADWLADIVAQIVTLAWWTGLDRRILPWLMIATTIEVTNAVFDFATTAKGRYPKLGRKSGFFVILQWGMPGGSYNWFGNFLWLAYPVFSLSWCIDLSLLDKSSAVASILIWTERLLFVPSILYVWTELAYVIVILNYWNEPARAQRSSAEKKMPTGFAGGVEVLGTVDKSGQDLLTEIHAASMKKLHAEWQSCSAKREIFWINLWQRSGDGKKIEVERVEELDAWAKMMASKHYRDDGVELDGYGFIINPINSKAQQWHIDYTLDYSSIFIPLSPLTPENTMQYLALPDSISREAFAAATHDLDHVNLDDLLSRGDYVNVRQMLARPMSIIKMDFKTIHRGISNTGRFDRCMFWISVKKRGALLPPEPAVEIIRPFSSPVGR